MIDEESTSSSSSLAPPPITVAFQTASNSSGIITSKEMLINYIHNLSKQDIRKLLAPIKDGLLTEDSVLYMNTQNFSVDHLIVPITVKDFLQEIPNTWKSWLHTVSSPGIPIDPSSPIHNPHEDILPEKVITEYVQSLNKEQRRALLNLVREGLLTDECFINVSTHRGPERVHIPMYKVINAIRVMESKQHTKRVQRNIVTRIILGKHYNSACFKNSMKADLDVRQLTSVRCTMPIWYTILFSLMTFGTFCSHIWSQITNYQHMQEHLQLTVPTILLIVSSCAIGGLLYLTIYIVMFLTCCEHNMGRGGLKLNDKLHFSSIFKHFSTLHYHKRRINATRLIQFVLLWYTMILAVYAHEKDLNIYPALACVLTNGFGLMLFARVAMFLDTCRPVLKGRAISAR